MRDASSADRPVRPAATVLLLRDAAGGPEVFLVRRHADAAFLGGAHVFPGGRVDQGDLTTADPRWCDGLERAAGALPGVGPADAIAHHVAAIRELFEECGVLLARDTAGAFVSLRDPDARARFTAYRDDLHAARLTLRDIAGRERLRIALDALTPFARWVTPPIDVRRFDTWFFAACAPPRQAPAHDERETVDSEWIAPAAAIARARAGVIVLPPPTWMTIREIEPFDSADAALAWARTRRIVRREPRVVQQPDGLNLLLMPGDPDNADDPGDAPPRETRFVQQAGQWRPQPAAAYHPAQETSE